MSIEVALLLATVLVAVVAVGAAITAVRAVRRADSATYADPVASPQIHTSAEGAEPATHATAVVPVPVRIVEGRVIAAPTEQQVLATALGRPAARLTIVASGLAHALRPESRDRIVALMRREYRHRRRVRQRAARQAARAVPAHAMHRDATWLGGSGAEVPSAPQETSDTRAGGG